MFAVWVNSPSPIIAEALGTLLRSLGYEARFEAGADVEVMLCDFSGGGPPYSPAPPIPTLALVSGDDDEELAELLLLGYRGYLLGYSDLEALERALEALARGEIWASRRVTSLALIKAFGDGELLSVEQARIAALARQGLSNREIAKGLGITEAKVKSCLRSSYKALGIHGRREMFLRDDGEA